MRVRGRRVVLLIAGALPLLAEDDRTSAAAAASLLQGVVEEPSSAILEDDATTITKSIPLHHQQDESSSDRSSQEGGGMKLPSLLPLNLLQVESEFHARTDNDNEDEEGYARGTSKLQQFSSRMVHDNTVLFLQQQQQQQQQPPDKDDDDTVETETEPPDAEPRQPKPNEADDIETADTDNNTATATDDDVQEGIANRQQQEQGDEEDNVEESEKLQGNATQPQHTKEDEHSASNSTATTSTNNNDEQIINSTDTNSSEESPEPEQDIQQDDATEQQQQQQQQPQSSSPQVDKKQVTTSSSSGDEDEDFISDRVAVDYASKSAGALVLEKSPQFKGTSNLLNGDRDKYAISPCNEKKFVVLSLSEDIYVKQIKLANYELYSSRVKDIQIQISQTMGNWVDLGIYTATPDSGVQPIDLREPAWGRYLKFKFLSHYGEEFYCTLSQIMVHGSTMVQGFHEHLQETNEEDEEDDKEEDNSIVEDDSSSTTTTADTASAATSTSSTAAAGATKTAESVASTTSTTTTTTTTLITTNKDAVPTASEATTDGSFSDTSLDEPDHSKDESHKKENVDEAAAAKSLADDKEVASPQEAVQNASSDTASEAVEEDATFSANDESKATGGDGIGSNGSTTNEGGSTTHGNDDDDYSDENDNLTKHDRNRNRAVYMSSRKDRNTSTALPAASIGLSSSNVFSTIVGRLEPLHLKGVEKLSKMRNPFPNPGHLNEMLSKASDSTKAIKNALTDPAILDHLQHWSETSRMNGDKSVNAETFGLTSIGPREQSLVEKLTAYIQQNDNNQIKRISSGDDNTTESDSPSPAEENSGGKEVAADVDSKQMNRDMEPNESQDAEKQPAEERKIEGTESFEDLHDTDLALVALLEKLPSIECLKSLDFAAFKAKAMASRKGGHGHSGHAAAGHAAEPLFKVLTDQIKTLQANLAVHDQFTKEAFQCYQRVLLDVVVELQSLRLNHETRLLQLEQDIQETKTVRWVFVIYQLIMGLPNWVSLSIATFVTSYISPVVISRPFVLAKSFLSTQLPRDEHAILSWTLTACVVVLSVVATVALCQRILSISKGSKSSRKSPPPGPSEEKSGSTETDGGGQRQPSNPQVAQPQGEVKEASIAPAVDPEDTTCVDCNLVTADTEGDPCAATPRVCHKTAATSCHNQSMHDSSPSETLHRSVQCDNITDSGMRTPDLASVGDETGEARKAPPSPSSVATLPACENEHKAEDQPDVVDEREMKRSVSVTLTISDGLGLKSGLTADSNLRRSVSTSAIEQLAAGCTLLKTA